MSKPARKLETPLRVGKAEESSFPAWLLDKGFNECLLMRIHHRPFFDSSDNF